MRRLRPPHAAVRSVRAAMPVLWSGWSTRPCGFAFVRTLLRGTENQEPVSPPRPASTPKASCREHSFAKHAGSPSCSFLKWCMILRYLLEVLQASPGGWGHPRGAVVCPRVPFPTWPPAHPKSWSGLGRDLPSVGAQCHMDRRATHCYTLLEEAIGRLCPQLGVVPAWPLPARTGGSLALPPRGALVRAVPA